MSQESVLSKVILPVVEVIFTLLGFVCKVELGEFPKCTESKHRESTRQTCHGAATTFDRAFEQLAMYILHVLKYGDKLMLGRCTCDDSSLRQHVPTASRLQLHLVHKVLYTVAIEDAVTVNEQHEQVVVAAEVILVYSIDKSERLLLTAAFAAVRETRNSDSTSTVSDVDTPGERFECDEDAELLDGSQVQLVFLFAVERQEDMQAAWRVLEVA
jgi:hypothetical protein